MFNGEQIQLIHYGSNLTSENNVKIKQIGGLQVKQLSAKIEYFLNKTNLANKCFNLHPKK